MLDMVNARAERHAAFRVATGERMTGREESDFAGMLNKLAEMGLIEMHLPDGSRIRSRVVDGCIAFDALPNEQAGSLNDQGDLTKRRRDKSIGPKRRIAAR